MQFYLILRVNAKNRKDAVLNYQKGVLIDILTTKRFINLRTNTMSDEQMQSSQEQEAQGQVEVQEGQTSTSEEQEAESTGESEEEQA